MEVFDFKCKYCGGELDKIDGLKSTGRCKYCGSKQTLPKLYNDKRANLFGRANHMRRNNEFDKAVALYEQILNEDPSDPEAYWSLVLCRFGIEYAEDSKTKERKPTVNRTQMTSIFADENYKSAIEYADDEQKKLYEHEANVINEIQKSILAISQNEDPFDVFICYKETDEDGKRSADSIMAYNIYRELTQKGYKVFYARETLSDKIGSEYEPYIFSALNSAKIMVVLGTRKEHFEAAWIRNEWSRFLGQIKNGEEKVLIPLYKDMDAYDLPLEFSNLQALDMSHIGYMQELVEGVDRIYKIIKGHISENNDTPLRIKKKKAKFFAICIPILSIILITAVVVLSMISPNASSASPEPSIIYTQEEFFSVRSFDGLSFTITNYNGYEEEVSVPPQINSKPITCIGANAFNESPIISIKIPDSVVNIDEYAFSNCSYLTSITIPDSVMSIGAYAFAYCQSLTSIAVPHYVANIGEYVFAYCQSLTSINIPDSVTSIGDRAFLGCSRLTSITFEGTKEQWNAISKASYWDYNTGNYTIYCTDGEMTK